MIAVTAWVAIGIVTGIAQALGVWRSAHHWRNAPLSVAWRLPAAMGVMVIAGMVGQVIPAALAWACGFVGSSVVMALRSEL
jgi:hypothetical protein